MVNKNMTCLKYTSVVIRVMPSFKFDIYFEITMLLITVITFYYF